MDRSARHVLDELLVLGAQGGDERAFAALVDRWHGPLLRHALRLTEREDAAADVTQEAWLSIARGLGKVDDPACFPRWAMQIVSRKSADWVRARQRERRMLTRLNELRVETESPGRMPTGDRVTRMREAMRRLPGDRRALLAMIYLDGLSITQVAELLGIPSGTVKSRLHHTRRELLDLMNRSE